MGYRGLYSHNGKEYGKPLYYIGLFRACLGSRIQNVALKAARPLGF